MPEKKWWPFVAVASRDILLINEHQGESTGSEQ
jgi:hypothetical protein